LASGRSLAEGARFYDFMADASRYKASLGTPSGEMTWLAVLQWDRLTFVWSPCCRRSCALDGPLYSRKKLYT
jgi:hypothetical protein